MCSIVSIKGAQTTSTEHEISQTSSIAISHQKNPPSINKNAVSLHFHYYRRGSSSSEQLNGDQRHRQCPTYMTSLPRLSSSKYDDVDNPSVGTGALAPSLSEYRGLYYEACTVASGKGAGGLPLPVRIANLQTASSPGR